MKLIKPKRRVLIGGGLPFRRIVKRGQAIWKPGRLSTRPPVTVPPN